MCEQIQDKISSFLTSNAPNKCWLVYSETFFTTNRVWIVILCLFPAITPSFSSTFTHLCTYTVLVQLLMHILDVSVRFKLCRTTPQHIKPKLEQLQNPLTTHPNFAAAGRPRSISNWAPSENKWEGRSENVWQTSIHGHHYWVRECVACMWVKCAVCELCIRGIVPPQQTDPEETETISGSQPGKLLSTVLFPPLWLWFTYMQSERKMLVIPKVPCLFLV